MIGRRLWDLGLLAPVQTGLRDVAAPFLQDLYGATKATVHLAVRDGTRALYLDRLSGHGSVPVVSRVGARLPLHSTGVGKVLLGYAPAEVRHAVLSRPLERFTPYTIVAPGRLEEQLRRVPRDGYATTSEEMTLGACSVAVPVLAGDAVVAALGLVLPDLRGRARLLPALRVAARGIGRSLSVELAEPELRPDFRPTEARCGTHGMGGPIKAACGLTLPSSGPDRPDCCLPICSPRTGSSRW